MATWNFVQVIRDIERMGFLDVILPFILIFTIIFAALQKTKILGDKEAPKNTDAETGKKYNMIVSLVIGLLVVIPHVVYNSGNHTSPYIGGLSIGTHRIPDVVNILNNSLPALAAWVVGILMLLLILGLFGAGSEEKKVLGAPIATWVTIAAIIIVIYIFGASAGWWYGSRNVLDKLYLGRASTQAGLIIILVFAAIIWFVTKGDGGTEEGGAKKAWNVWFTGNEQGKPGTTQG